MGHVYQWVWNLQGSVLLENTGFVAAPWVFVHERLVSGVRPPVVRNRDRSRNQNLLDGQVHQLISPLQDGYGIVS